MTFFKHILLLISGVTYGLAAKGSEPHDDLHSEFTKERYDRKNKSYTVNLQGHLNTTKNTTETFLLSSNLILI